MALFPTTPDRVAVLNSGFQQVFPDARPISCRVNESSRLFDHTIETGQIITDYAILNPIEIEIVMVVQEASYRSTYQQIRSLYVSKQLLTVQTNTSNYQNMVIGDMPHEERPDLFDALPITLRFRQVQIVPDPVTFAPANPAQLDTQAVGQQNAQPAVQIDQGAIGDFIPNLSPNSNAIGYSSVPNLTSTGMTISGVATNSGIQTITNPLDEEIPVTGVQTFTSQKSIGSVLQ